MALKPSGEMYLETIYVLGQSMPSVRSIDVAEHMNFSKPSVSRAVGNLKQDNYISVDCNGFITLTEEGFALARKIYERHTVLSKALMLLGVDEETAAEDACKIEHIISEKSFETIRKHVEEKDPAGKK